MKKRYYNNETKEWYTEGGAMTRRAGGGVFSGVPSEELLAEWGFAEYVEPEPTPEELLERARQEKLAALEAFDGSEAVNSFLLGGQTMWLSVSERQQLATQISASEAVGRESMTRWFGGQEFTFGLDQWKQMLVALEVYAGDALNVTKRHEAAVLQLPTVQEVEGYDFTAGYPPKLNFGG